MALLRVPLRASAVSFAITAGLLVAQTLLHPSILDRPVSDVVRDTALWTLMHLAGLIVAVLGLLGAAGLVAVHGDRMGGLGRAGLVTTLVGSCAAGGVAAVEAAVFPVLAERAPDMLDLDGPLLTSWPFLLVGVAAVGWILGLGMIGAAAARSTVFPRAAGILLAVGSVLFLVLEIPFVPVVGQPSGVLFGAALAWWGWLLWEAAPASGGSATTGNMKGLQ